MDQKALTKWEALARQDLPPDALERFYELAGKLQFSANLPPEEADKKAFMKVARNE